MPRTVTDWFSIIQEKSDDLGAAKFLLGELLHYQSGRAFEYDDLKQTINFIAAIRMDQLAKTKLASPESAETA